MEQSPSWEGNSHSASQEISRLLWNPEVYYHVDKGPLLVHILSQLNAVHTLPHYFPKIHYNIFLYTPKSSAWSLPFRFSDQNYICFSHLHFSCYMPPPISYSL